MNKERLAKPSPETGEADVKAAREVLRGLYAYPPHSTVQALAAALASARAEGEAAGFEVGQALMHAHCLADEINQHRQEWEAAGAAKERETVVRWLRNTDPRTIGAALAYRHAETFERGDHLRALTPEGKR